jgi:hypothetical protein
MKFMAWKWNEEDEWKKIDIEFIILHHFRHLMNVGLEYVIYFCWINFFCGVWTKRKSLNEKLKFVETS